MKRSFQLRLGAILFVLVFLSSSLSFFGEEAEIKEEEPQISGEYAVIFNADDDGEILYGKNETKQVYCGFLPRVMTCLLIAQSGKLDETVTVNRGMLVNTPQISTAQLKAGDVVTYRDLITCICVVNSQEAAVAAATALAGDSKTFVQQMNDKAKELGATDTLFTNVTGNFVSNTKQITTLADCAKIISAALQEEVIAEAATLRTAKITVSGKTKNLYTRNMLIEPTGKNYDAAAKGLFIYSQSASNSAIATYRKDSDRKIISMTVTTAGLEAVYKDAGTLLKYSQNRYVSRTLLTKGSSLQEVTVKNGKDVDFVVLAAAEDITALIPKIYGDQKATMTFDLPQSVEAPIEKGTVLGTVTVSCGGKEYGTVELKAQATVELDYFELYSSKMMKFFANPWLWIILAGLLFIVVGYALFAYRLNNPRKKKTSARETGSRIRITRSAEDDE
ncbi:MAG: D-alanyl-D-alanine carboxypeptidase [Clostridia bacterium]|nr:D-alanyl-D-alanine carboxypeptidase [Clostridia bacterium]